MADTSRIESLLNDAVGHAMDYARGDNSATNKHEAAWNEAITLIREMAREPLSARVEANTETFTAWLCEQMPQGTVIGDPKWWAPKILQAVRAFTEVPAPVVAREAVAWALYRDEQEKPWDIVSTHSEAVYCAAPGDRIVPLYPQPSAGAVTEDGWIVWAKKRKGGKRHLVLSDRGVIPYKHNDESFALQMGAHGFYEWEMVHVTTAQSEWKYMTPLVLLDHAALQAREVQS